MNQRHKAYIRCVCSRCGREYEQAHVQEGTEEFYCGARCRASGYQERHIENDWLLLRVLGRAYQVIQGAGLNFELEVDLSEYPGRKAFRGEYNGFVEWARKFAVGRADHLEGGQDNGVKPEPE